MVYRGSWDFVAKPYYPTGQSAGAYFIVSNGATINGVNYNTKDWIVYNGITWEKVDNTDSVTTVQGRIGNVVITADDLDALTDTNIKNVGNKSFDDNSNGFVSVLDRTRMGRFDATDITSATTRTYKMPDANGMLVLDTMYQAVSNKTFNTTNEFADAAVGTRKMGFNLSGISNNTKRTLAIQDKDYTIAGKDDTVDRKQYTDTSITANTWYRILQSTANPISGIIHIKFGTLGDCMLLISDKSITQLYLACFSDSLIDQVTIRLLYDGTTSYLEVKSGVGVANVVTNFINLVNVTPVRPYTAQVDTLPDGFTQNLLLLKDGFMTTDDIYGNDAVLSGNLNVVGTITATDGNMSFPTKAELLKNKGLEDSTTTIFNTSNTTKVAKFSTANISSLTSRTYFFPDVSGTFVLTGDQSTLTNKTLTSPKIGTSILDVNGANLITITPSASANNYLNITNSQNSNPAINAAGASTNVGIAFVTKGTGMLTYNGQDIVDINRTQTLANKTLTNPKISSSLYDSNGNKSIQLNATAAAVDYLTVTNATAAGNTTIGIDGTTVNANLNIASKGTGKVYINNYEALHLGNINTVSAEGHKIMDGNNTVMTQRKNLRFVNAVVSDDGTGNITNVALKTSATYTKSFVIADWQGTDPDYYINVSPEEHLLEASNFVVELFDANGNKIAGGVRIDASNNIVLSSSKKVDCKVVAIGNRSETVPESYLEKGQSYSELSSVNKTIIGAINEAYGLATGGVTFSGNTLKVTSYVKPGATSAIAPTDTINQALGKLEKKFDTLSITPINVIANCQGSTTGIASADLTYSIYSDVENIKSGTTAAANATKLNGQAATYYATASSVTAKLSSVLQDTAPILGGELDQNGYTICGTETTNGSSGTAKTINWKNGNHQKVTMTGNCIFSFTAPTKACMLSLRIIQDSTGGRTITLPTMKWPGGTAPVFSTAPNSIDLLTIYYDGTTYYGQVGLAFA
jgi:hypothetical protein